MQEFRMSATLSVDVEIYFEAADEDAADAIAESIVEAAALALAEPSVSDIVAVDSSMQGVVLDISYDGPNGGDINDGPWED